VRKASGRVTRRFALHVSHRFDLVDGSGAYLSSRVRSNHWTEAVIKVFW
jgi:hypothetical protein